MSVRFDASGDRYTATTGLPNTVFTILCWARVAVDRNAYSTIFSIDNGGTTQVLSVQTDADGVSPYLWMAPHGAGFIDESPAVTMTVGSWYRCAVVRNGTAVTFYFAPASGSVSTASGTLTGTLTPTTLRIGESPAGGEWFNGNIANLKVYSATLTQAEIVAEWGNWQAQRTTGLLRHHKWQTAAETTDYSGNANALTAVGTPTFEATNPSIADSAPSGGGGETLTAFGKTTDGASDTASTADKTAVSLITATTDGTLVSGGARLWMTGGATTAKLVAYANTGGAPGALLASSDAKTINNTAEAEIKFTFSGGNRIAVTSGTSYWAGAAWQDPGTDSIRLSRDGTTDGRREVSAYAPDPFGTPTSLTGPIDVFLEVSAATGGSGTPAVSPLKVGATSISALRVGTAAVLRAYLGTALMWGTAPTTVTPANPANMIDVIAASYTASNGQNGNYHRYAANLPYDQELGLMVQLHGDGYQEYTERDTTSYSIGGTEGLLRQARYRKMICVVARTPDEVGETWWENGTVNSVYLRDLINNLLGTFPNVSRGKIWLVGYSGGSEQIARYFMPSSSSTLEGGGAFCFGGGGLPDTTEQPYSTALKANFPMKWWTGTADNGTSEANSPGLYDALTDSQEGSAHYATKGFTTYLENPPGLNHFGADGRYGAIWGQFYHQVKVASTASGTATRTSTGVSWTGTVTDAPAVTLRASTTPFGSQTGTWVVGAVDYTTRAVTVAVTGFGASGTLYWRIELGGNAAQGPVLASGSVG